MSTVFHIDTVILSRNIGQSALDIKYTCDRIIMLCTPPFLPVENLSRLAALNDLLRIKQNHFSNLLKELES